jgi:hypothetical protein
MRETTATATKADTARHTPHVTRHTPHVTRHTSHVKRQTSNVTRHTSHVTRHTPHVTRHLSVVNCEVGTVVAAEEHGVNEGGERNDSSLQHSASASVVMMTNACAHKRRTIAFEKKCCGLRVLGQKATCTTEGVEPTTMMLSPVMTSCHSVWRCLRQPNRLVAKQMSSGAGACKNASLCQCAWL